MYLSASQNSLVSICSRWQLEQVENISQLAGEALLGHFPSDVTFQLGKVSLPTSLSLCGHFLLLSSCSTSGMLFQDLWNMVCFLPPKNTFIALPSLCLAAKIRSVYSIHWRQTNVTLNKNSYMDEKKWEKISVHTDRLLCCDLSGTETSSQFTSWYHTTAVIRSSYLPPLFNQAWVWENTRVVRAQTRLCGDHRSTSALHCVGRDVPWYLSWMQTPDCLHCRSITLPWWQASIPRHSSLLEVVFCDRGRLFARALLLHIAALYMSCKIFVIYQMTGACLNKFYRGQELVDEGAHSSGSIW